MHFSSCHSQLCHSGEYTPASQRFLRNKQPQRPSLHSSNGRRLCIEILSHLATWTFLFWSTPFCSGYLCYIPPKWVTSTITPCSHVSLPRRTLSLLKLIEKCGSLHLSQGTAFQHHHRLVFQQGFQCHRCDPQDHPMRANGFPEHLGSHFSCQSDQRNRLFLIAHIAVPDGDL